MDITVNINKCLDCRHTDHSGAFTPGGAISICQHEGAPKRGEVPGVKDFNDVTTKEIALAIFGPRRLNKDNSIPDWCPLSRGEKY